MRALRERSWNTAHEPEERQLAQWQAIATDAFVPVQVMPVHSGGGAFPAELRVRPLGEFGFAWLSCAEHQMERTSAHIDTRRAGVYFLNLPTAGVSTARQDGHEYRMGVGDLGLIDADRPFSLTFEGSLSQLCLTIPKGRLDPLLLAHGVGVAHLDGRHGVAAVVAASLYALAGQTDVLTPGESWAVADHLSSLLALAVNGHEAEPFVSSRITLLQLAIDEIERSLADAELSADQVARHLSISTSYLTKLFAGQGTSFGRFLLARRLEKGWSLLDPALQDPRTVTGIASACGFRDPGHFARAFRLKFGITPTERRLGSVGLTDVDVTGAQDRRA